MEVDGRLATGCICNGHGGRGLPLVSYPLSSAGPQLIHNVGC